jgi:SRSO17 transposase
MVKPRPAVPAAKFIDEYCDWYRELFPGVRSFEYFKYLHLGLISEVKRKMLPAIARVVWLASPQPLDYFYRSPWPVEEVRTRRLALILKIIGGAEIIVVIDETGARKRKIRPIM